MDPIRFALIGCGYFGSKRARAFSEVNTARLVCVIDRNIERAKTLAAISDCEYYADHLQALAHEQVDCVIIATPNNTHAQISIDAMSRGKHVICEKPLATSVSEASLMVRASEENKVKLKVGSNLRYFPNVMKAKEIVDNGKIGSLIFLRGWIGNAGSHLNASWYSDPMTAGGGTLIDNGYHLIDLSRWFLGDFSYAVGHICTLCHNVSSEDNAVFLLKTEHGPFAFVQSSWTEWNGYIYVEVYGKKGFLVIDCREGKNRLVLREGSNAGQEYNFGTRGLSSYAREISDFADAVRYDCEIRPTGMDGLRVLELIEQVYKSSWNSQH